MRIDHVGYAVRDLEKAKAAFLQLGYSPEAKAIDDAGRKVRIQFLAKDGYRLELITPLQESSPIEGILDKIGPTAYHICYAVSDLEEAIRGLQAQRYRIVQPPEAAPALQDRRVAFLMNLTMGLIELVEEPKSL